MHKILFLTILFLFTGCFYKYSSKSLGLTTHLYFPSGEFHDSYKELFFSIPDSLIDTSSNIFYLGICAQVHIRILTYSSKKKLNDTLFNKCIINNRLINEKKDSLKEEGIRFTSFATGGGRRLKVKIFI